MQSTMASEPQICPDPGQETVMPLTLDWSSARRAPFVGRAMAVASRHASYYGRKQESVVKFCGWTVGLFSRGTMGLLLENRIEPKLDARSQATNDGALF